MKKSHDRTEPTKKPVEIRPDLQDGKRGKDLSYLNEMPQMGGYEGVKAGAPPKKENQEKPVTKNKKEKS